MAVLVITLILLLGSMDRFVMAQSPDLFLITDRGSDSFSCPGDAVTYRCRGNGTVLIWNLVTYSQILYESNNNEPGDGGVAGPAVSTLVDESPLIDSTLSVIDDQSSEITIICSTGPDILSVSSSRIVYRTEPPVSGSPTISITVGVGSNGSTYIFVRCIAPAGAIQMDHCLIKVYVNDSLLADLRAPELSCIPVPYTLADGESIFVNASGRVVTRCNQTSLEGFNTYEYTYNNTQVISQNSNSTATSCPPNKGPPDCDIICIILVILAGILAGTSVCLVIVLIIKKVLQAKQKKVTNLSEKRMENEMSSNISDK